MKTLMILGFLGAVALSAASPARADEKDDKIKALEKEVADLKAKLHKLEQAPREKAPDNKQDAKEIRILILSSDFTIKEQKIGENDDEFATRLVSSETSLEEAKKLAALHRASIEKSKPKTQYEFYKDWLSQQQKTAQKMVDRYDLMMKKAQIDATSESVVIRSTAEGNFKTGSTFYPIWKRLLDDINDRIERGEKVNPANKP